MYMIETPFGFLEVRKEGIGADTARLAKRFLTLLQNESMPLMWRRPQPKHWRCGEPVMLVAFEKQAFVSAPPISENDAFIDRRDMSVNHLE